MTGIASPIFTVDAGAEAIIPTSANINHAAIINITPGSHLILEGEMIDYFPTGSTHKGQIRLNFGTAEDSKWWVQISQSVSGTSAKDIEVLTNSGGGGGTFPIAANTWTPFLMDLQGATLTMSMAGTIRAMLIDSFPWPIEDLTEFWLELQTNAGLNPVLGVRKLKLTSIP